MSRRQILQLLVVVVVVAAFIAAWVFLPIREYATPEAIGRLIAPVVESPWLPLYILAAFILTSAVLISVWLVILQTCLLYGPLVAFPLALGGATLAALTYYGVGRLLGRDVVVRHVPVRVQQALSTVTLESIIAIRVLPILPFTLVNLTCGAFGVPLRTFVVGTVIGMAPGVLGMALLGERLLAVIRDPTPGAIGALVVVIAIVLVVARAFRRRAAARYLQDAIAQQAAAGSVDAAVDVRPPPAAP